MAHGIEGGHLRDVLHAQVQRVDEPPRRRQVGRGLHRGDRLGRVQRVDEDEVRLVRGRRPGRDVGEVPQVADAPGPRRAHLVELGHQADDPPRGDRLGQLQALRGDHERARERGRVERVAVDLGDQPVPAERQVGGDGEGRLPDRSPVDDAVGDPPVDLGDGAGPAVLELDTDGDGGTGRHVDGHLVLTARPRHDGRRQGTAPRGVGVVGERVLDLGVGRGCHPEGGEDGADGVGRDRDVLAEPVPVLRRDTVGLGELDEPGRRGGLHDPILPTAGPGADAGPLPAPRAVRGSASSGAGVRAPSGPAGPRRPRSSRPGSCRPCPREPSWPAARRCRPRRRRG